MITDKVIRIDGPINFADIMSAINEILNDNIKIPANAKITKEHGFSPEPVYRPSFAGYVEPEFVSNEEESFTETEVDQDRWLSKELGNDPSKAALFQWGNTKCAVILKDMAQTYDALMNTNRVTRYVQKGLTELRTLTKIIGQDYDNQCGNSERVPVFREKYLWDYAENNLIYKKFNAPEEFWSVYRSLVKEIINTEKRYLGIMPFRTDGYTNEDVYEWEKSDKVKIARSKFKTLLKRYLADYKPFHSN